MDSCTACGKPIRWVITTGGKRLPLDVDPVADGNVVPVVIEGQRRARVLTGTELPAQEQAWQSHHRSCPHAADFRRRKGATTSRCRSCRQPMDPWLTTHGWHYHVNCAPPTGAELREAIDTLRSA
jgi:hypothetical protein